MTAYDNDPRVRQANPYQYDVQGDDKYLISDDQGWWVDLSSSAAGDLHAFQSRGPYDTADEAIRSLIGDPE